MYVENEILKSLSETDRKALAAHLRRKFFPAGTTIAKRNDPIDEIFFPESGLISLITELSDGSRVGTGLIGKASGVGACGALGINRHGSAALVLMPATGHLASVQAVLDIARRNEPLRHALFENEFRLMTQAQQIAACNARHNISQRLSSWFLRARDATGSDQIVLTQDFLAHLLGVQRASVSLEASRLQDAGLIRYRRGTIELADIGGLQALACECGAAVRKATGAVRVVGGEAQSGARESA